MRSLFLSLSLLISLSCSPSAIRAPVYESEPEHEATPVAPPVARRAPSGPRTVRLPMLWQLSSGEANNYVFGTLPFGVTLDQAFSPDSLAQLVNARKLYLEVDADAGSLDNFDSYESLVQLPSGERLDDHVAGSAVHRLTNSLLHVVDPLRLRSVHPWVALRFYIRKLTGNVDPTMGLALFAYVQEQGMELTPLTNTDDQIEALNGPSDDSMGDLLERLVRNESEIHTAISPVVRAYMDGDAEGIAVTMESSALSPYFRARYGEGARFKNQIEADFAEGGTFVAIDVGYLVGENGLIAALESAGFEATLLGR